MSRWHGSFRHNLKTPLELRNGNKRGKCARFQRSLLGNLNTHSISHDAHLRIGFSLVQQFEPAFSLQYWRRRGPISTLASSEHFSAYLGQHIPVVLAPG